LPGDLWIGGVGLARGYINKPDLTDEVFHPNPFTTSPNDRYYRSGDIARYLPDGNLEMLGRSDNQVKIRGYRIELGEIEAVLGKHKAIEELVVVARELELPSDPDRSEEKRLIAYFQPKPSNGSKDLPNEFRNYLRDKLPDYMTPAYFIKMDSFPLTVHGKVDYQALPLPDETDFDRPHEYVPARNSTERQLVEIWEQVLGIQPIGVRDNFFDLGGHSLMAVRLFSQIENKIGVKLPLMTLFDVPTIANQARSLQSSREESDPTWVVEVQTGGSKAPFFCVSPSVIDVITYRELSRNLGDEQPFYALYSEDMGLWREGKYQLETITEQLIERIQKVDPSGPYNIGGYSAGGIVALEIAQQLKMRGFETSLLVLFDTFGPNYPRLKSGISPTMFNALLVLRRIQSYWWKFRLLNWKGKLQYLRLPRIHTWVRDRYGEVKTPAPPPAEGGAYYLTPARREFKPEKYEGKVLLVRAEKGLIGIHKDAEMGWGDVFSGKFDVCMVPGDHEAMLFGPRSRFVADQLVTYLESSIKTS
jgi:thioesterase domain-containing protein/acyl carrier protein